MLYQQLGFLAFGSRLRRLSEGFLSEINATYRALNIPFDASWFPVFYLLDQEGKVSIRDISDKAGVSHSAVSQLVSLLQDKGLVESVVSEVDARKKVLSFTAEGKKLLKRVKPVWTALEASLEDLSQENAALKQLLKTVLQLEKALETKPLSARIIQQIQS